MDKKIKKPLDVLIIEAGLGPGGAFQCAAKIVKNMDKTMFAMHFFYPNDWPQYENLTADVKAFTVKQYRYRQCANGFEFVVNFFLGTLPFILKMYFYSKINEIRIVHANNDILTNCAGILTARLLGVPCISHIRGNNYNSAFVRFLARRVTLFIVVSEYVKNNLIKLGIDPGKIRVIYDGFDEKKYDPGTDVSSQKKEFQISENVFAIGVTSLLIRWKGHMTFLNAAKEVLAEVPNCKFFIIGDVPTKSSRYKYELMDAAKTMGISDRVIFTGYRVDMPQMLKILDIVVCPSIVPDPLPGAAIQAMAMGRAVIGSDCGGIPEIIKDGESGILFRPGDTKELKNAIIRLLKSKEERQRLGENARKAFLDKFILRFEIEKIAEIYKEMVGNKKQQ